MAKQLEYRSALHNLAADSVQSIQVGEVRLERPADVTSVVNALRNSQWFAHTAGDGGWAPAVVLLIRFKTGEERRYRVGRLLKREGAVIDFISQDVSSQFIGHDGYAFTKGLPDALDRLGAPLPR
jgi:hypothetical protein